MVERFGLQALVLALLLVVAGAVGAATSATPEPATLRILNREIVTFRAELLGAAPAQRVERARDRLRRCARGTPAYSAAIMTFSRAENSGMR